MRFYLQQLILLFVLMLFSCQSEIETEPVDFGYDYQPMEVGLFWIYEVDQTIYFGENDSERFTYFYKDIIRSSYINAENEQVFIVDRSKSPNKNNWAKEMEYTLIRRDFSVVRTSQNQPLITIVFPVKSGSVWNANAYRDAPIDEFEYADTGLADQYLVRQEESTDEVTYFDHRYEIYNRGVGLIEKYYEVLTYCSRNDCLGDQLIDSGYKTLMKLTDNGKN